jgi:hypothetical protein
MKILIKLYFQPSKFQWINNFKFALFSLVSKLCKKLIKKYLLQTLL